MDRSQDRQPVAPAPSRGVLLLISAAAPGASTMPTRPSVSAAAGTRIDVGEPRSTCNAGRPPRSVKAPGAGRRDQAASGSGSATSAKSASGSP